MKSERISKIPVMIRPAVDPIRVGISTLPSIVPRIFMLDRKLKQVSMIIPAKVERMIGVLKIGM